MGINGLHQATKHYISNTHISEYKGKRVGCDGSAWLHRGASPHSWEIFNCEKPWERSGKDPPWVAYTMSMVRLLRSHGVEPVLVFDGCRNPAKEPTSKNRSDRRQKAREKLDAAMKNKDEAAAKMYAAQVVEITPEMAFDVQIRLREAAVQYVVAPYEADAQLAYLARVPYERGGVAAVLTEDSDLVAFGCNVVLFKCHVQLGGRAERLELESMLSREPVQQPGENNQAGEGAGTSKTAKKSGKELSFHNWSKDMFLTMCVLSGCDFFESLSGLGFKTAHALVKEGRSMDGTLALMRKHKRWGSVYTPEFEAGAKKARQSFLYTLVYDPVAGCTVRLNELPEALAALQDPEFRHMGPDLDPEIARFIAHGYLNPHTLQPYNPRVPPPPLEYRWVMQPLPQGNQQQGGRAGSWFTAGTAAGGEYRQGSHRGNNGNHPAQQAQQAQQQQHGIAGASNPFGHHPSGVVTNRDAGPPVSRAAEQVQDIMQIYAASAQPQQAQHTHGAQQHQPQQQQPHASHPGPSSTYRGQDPSGRLHLIPGGATHRAITDPPPTSTAGGTNAPPGRSSYQFNNQPPPNQVQMLQQGHHSSAGVATAWGTRPAAPAPATSAHPLKSPPGEMKGSIHPFARHLQGPTPPLHQHKQHQQHRGAFPALPSLPRPRPPTAAPQLRLHTTSNQPAHSSQPSVSLTDLLNCSSADGHPSSSSGQQQQPQAQAHPRCGPPRTSTARPREPSRLGPTADPGSNSASLVGLLNCNTINSAPGGASSCQAQQERGQGSVWGGGHGGGSSCAPALGEGDLRDYSNNHRNGGNRRVPMSYAMSLGTGAALSGGHRSHPGEQPEVTSPLKTRPGATEQMKSSDHLEDRCIIDLTNEGQAREQQQVKQQQQRPQPGAWRVKKSEPQNLYRTSSGGASMYSGASGGSSAGSGVKRRGASGSGGGGEGRRGKKATVFAVAATNCARISSFFKPEPSK